MEVGRLVGAWLLWWEQVFLVELVLWVVGPLEAHSAQSLEWERLAVASGVGALVVERQVAKSG